MPAQKASLVVPPRSRASVCTTVSVSQHHDGVQRHVWMGHVGGSSKGVHTGKTGTRMVASRATMSETVAMVIITAYSCLPGDHSVPSSCLRPSCSSWSDDHPSSTFAGLWSCPRVVGTVPGNCMVESCDMVWKGLHSKTRRRPARSVDGREKAPETRTTVAAHGSARSRHLAERHSYISLEAAVSLESANRLAGHSKVSTCPRVHREKSLRNQYIDSSTLSLAVRMWRHRASPRTQRGFPVLHSSHRRNALTESP